MASIGEEKMIDKTKILSDNINRHFFHFKKDIEKAFLVVLSDIHEGMNHRKYFQDIIQFILSIPNCYVIIGGDAINATTKTSKGNTTEEWASGDKQIYSLVEDLKPLVSENRIIAIAEDGNHADRIYQDTFISPNKMLAALLGIPNKYTGNYCLGMLDIGTVNYCVSVVHKNRKTSNYYEYLRTDILIREHWHELRYESKLVYDWNKFNKSVSCKTAYDIYNGSFLNIPEYAKKQNYRPQTLGCYFILLDGKKRNIQPFIDSDLKYLIENGLKIK